MQVTASSRMNACCQGARPLVAPRRRSGAAPAPPRSVRVRTSGEEAGESPLAGNPLFSAQFAGVLQQSLARQGPDALTTSIKAEPRASATEEVLEASLQQSKQTLSQLLAWREQVERQINAQYKQIDRMEFALNKSRGDAAYTNALKEMLHGDM